VVIVCISPEHSSLKYGNALKLVYTAISRAQQNLIILGDPSVLFKSQHIVEKNYISSFMEQFTEIETPDWI
jgi:ATP-dependent exoDNAse (exonuclease V) alpha subunit